MNLSISVRRTSLRCDAVDYEFYRRIAGSGDPYGKPFPTMYDAFIAFACIGYHYDNFIPLGVAASDKEELTLASYMVDDKRLWTLAALAYAHAKRQHENVDELELARLVLDTNSLIPLVEGWANGGAKLVRAQFDSGELKENRTVGLAEILLEDLA